MVGAGLRSHLSLWDAAGESQSPFSGHLKGLLGHIATIDSMVCSKKGMKKAGAHGRLCFFVAIFLWHVATRFAMNISRSCPAEHASWCSNG